MPENIPDLAGFEEHFGIKVSCFGEDGDLVALGHHDPRRALAAFNRYTKSLIGLPDLLDGTAMRSPEGWKAAAARVKPAWAYMIGNCDAGGEPDHDEGECPECEEIQQFGWYMTITHETNQGLPGTFPVTLYTA